MFIRRMRAHTTRVCVCVYCFLVRTIIALKHPNAFNSHDHTAAAAAARSQAQDRATAAADDGVAAAVALAAVA